MIIFKSSGTSDTTTGESEVAILGESLASPQEKKSSKQP